MYTHDGLYLLVHIDYTYIVAHVPSPQPKMKIKKKTTKNISVSNSISIKSSSILDKSGYHLALSMLRTFTFIRNTYSFFYYDPKYLKHDVFEHHLMMDKHYHIVVDQILNIWNEVCLDFQKKEITEISVIFKNTHSQRKVLSKILKLKFSEITELFELTKILQVSLPKLII